MTPTPTQALEPVEVTQAEAYCLGLLTEEAGEILQLVGKALRFGIDTPGVKRLDGTIDYALTSRSMLPVELGDFLAGIDFAIAHGVIDATALAEQRTRKLAKLTDPTVMDNLGRPLAPQPDLTPSALSGDHRQSSNAASVGVDVRDVLERCAAGLEGLSAQNAADPLLQDWADALAETARAALASLSTPTAEPVCRDNELTPEFRAMTALQKWETLTLHGLLGTNEPWIENMRQHLKADAAARVGNTEMPQWGEGYVDATITNEHGNVIGITVRKPFFDQGDPDARNLNRRSVSIEISGPDSQHENHITLLEARALATCLNAALSPLSDLHPLGQEYDGDALREAAQRVLDGLDRRIEASALSDPVPVFEGIADLRRALSATPPAQTDPIAQIASDLAAGQTESQRND